MHIYDLGISAQGKVLTAVSHLMEVNATVIGDHPLANNIAAALENFASITLQGKAVGTSVSFHMWADFLWRISWYTFLFDIKTFLATRKDRMKKIFF